MTSIKPFSLKWRRTSVSQVRGYASGKLAATINRVDEGIYEVSVKNGRLITSWGWHQAKKCARDEWSRVQKRFSP